MITSLPERDSDPVVERSGDELVNAAEPEFEISDLLDPEHWSQGLNRFADATNLAVALTDAAGRIIGSCINPRPLWIAVRERFPARPNACPFCLLPTPSAPCSKPAFGKGGMEEVADANGMAHLIVPLMFDGHRIGTLLAGQCFNHYVDAKLVDRLARQFHIVPDRLWRAARMEFPISCRSLKIYGRLLVTLGQTMLQTRADALRQSARLREVSELGDALAQEVIQRTKAQLELAKERDSLEVAVTQRTSELQKSHERMRLSERLAAIGTLAAGLGHDMGNLLFPLRARLDAIDQRNHSQETHADIEAIREYARYLQRLTKGLRTFAMEASPEGTTDLTFWQAEIDVFFRNAVPRHVELHWELAADTGPVAIDASSLTQVVFNLVQNAGDAMKDQPSGRVVVWSRADEAAKQIKIGVTDTGPGMTEEVKQRCIEPFFTTKTRKLSTGLGLAIAHGIIQKALGTLDIETEPGRGTTFVLTLPLAQASANAASVHARALAIVSIRDDRRRACVAAVLASENCQVLQPDDSSDAPGAFLVCDLDEGAAEITPFLAANPDGRVMVLSRSPAQGSNDQRISMIEGTPSAIKRELRRMLL